MSRLLIAGLLALASLISPVTAQQLLTEYSAYIGAADLRNSSGAPLSAPWQVIRQDRANVHRFGIRQPGDDVDPFFGDFDARGRLEALIRSGFVSEEAASAIMRGEVRVRVSVFGTGGVPQRVEVQVWDAPSRVVPGPAPVPEPAPGGSVAPPEAEPVL